MFGRPLFLAQRPFRLCSIEPGRREISSAAGCGGDVSRDGTVRIEEDGDGRVGWMASR